MGSSFSFVLVSEIMSYGSSYVPKPKDDDDDDELMVEMLLLVLLLIEPAETLRVSGDRDGGETFSFLDSSCAITYWGDHSTELIFWISPRWRRGREGVAVLCFMVSAI